jgi:anti-anti-sigma factor
VSSRPDFEVIVERTASDARLIQVRGELDSGTCEKLIEAFQQALAQADVAELTLDLRGITFVDSKGTRAIIMIEQSAAERGVSLVVMPPPEQVNQLLRTAGVTERVEPSPASAPPPRDSEFTERVELELPRDPLSPGRARAEIRELMSGRTDQDELANLVLLTSELVTNAVVHPRCAGQTPIGLRITTYSDGVRVEVEDAGEGFDMAAPARAASEGGRGLFLVDRCAAKWGARRAQTERGPRFRVWFELDWREPGAVVAAPE